jgi:copper ion binding protein
MARQVLNVTGMSCNHCKMAVEKAVAAIEGVEKVDADVKKNRVTVNYREGPGTLDLVKAAITEAGYTVQAS